ncbi:MAG: ABC transporter permease, partial [Chloroflexi bacterium]|nr:ABC transporter permease [Chloroflexota bacterium]
IGTLLIILPAIWWRYSPPVTYVGFFENPVENLRLYLLPAVSLGLQLSASTMRMTRSSMLEVMRQDYIRTAWAKGLQERVVIARHALKNAMIPVVTIMGTQIGRLLGGSVVVEFIFGLPGFGRLLIESIQQRDLTQLQGNIVFIAAVFLLINLLVDLTYGWLDPRIRY